MRFSEDFLSQVKQKNDILDTISPYVDLKVRGSTAVGLCPFHNEKTPSFTVYVNTQSFYCFGCGLGGDVITFVKNMENLAYPDAVTYLANKAGLQLPQDPESDKTAELKRRILNANREAAKFYHSYLFSENGKDALNYLLKRGLTASTVRHFGLGYAPNGWDELKRRLKSLGFNETELILADLLRKTKKGNVIDAFRNRIMFPIIDVNGNITAFGGRVMDDSKPKYINTSDTPVYKKSEGIYALNFAKKQTGKTLILCEGYMDVIAYHQAGFTNAVACLGTAFTENQAKLLNRYCEEIILSYDNDEAGLKAAKRAIGILQNTTLRVKVARLSGGKDPDEIIRKGGKEHIIKILRDALGDVEFDLEKAKEDYDLSSPSDTAAYIEKAADVVAKLGNPVKWDIYASKISKDTNVDKDAILSQIKISSKKQKKRDENEKLRKAYAFNDSILNELNPERRSNLPAAKAEELLLACVLKNPEFYKKIKDSLTDDDFSTKFNLKIYKAAAKTIELYGSANISLFGEDLTDKETGYIVRLKSSVAGTTLKECRDSIDRMKSEKREKLSKNASDMTDEEWALEFEKLRRSKK